MKEVEAEVLEVLVAGLTGGRRGGAVTDKEDVCDPSLCSVMNVEGGQYCGASSICLPSLHNGRKRAFKRGNVRK